MYDHLADSCVKVTERKNLVGHEIIHIHVVALSTQYLHFTSCFCNKVELIGHGYMTWLGEQPDQVCDFPIAI